MNWMEETNKVSTTSKNNGWMLFALFLGYVMIYIDKLTIGVALVPMAQEYGLSAENKGLIMSAFFLGYMFLQIPAGILNNKIGSRIILIGSIACIGLFMFFFGFGSSLLYFVVIRFLSGAIAHSGYPSSASKELLLNYPVEKRTFAQGILLASSGVAGFIGPILVSPLIKNVGWRTAYQVIAAVAIAVAVFIAIKIPKNKPAAAVETKKSMSMREVWSDYRVWVLTFAALAINSLLYGFTSWLPTYLIVEKGLDLVQAGYINSITGLFALVGAIGGSYVIGKYFAGKEKMIIFTFCLIGTLLMFSAYFVGSFVLLTIILGLANFFLIITFITMMSLPLKLFAGERFTPSYATIGTGGVLGGVLAPIIIGKLLTLFNGAFLGAFFFFLIAGALTSIIILFIKIKK
ncbi:Sugar phosphate permease [Isobaculum melis]|uniref:Sugar phosphate permease n=2 Tax=Isobaculum melis TaxID=142588 RepID=A0A1H9PYJ0_9LACT|nr:Sugar phosphate permease [Isobaculum melis]